LYLKTYGYTIGSNSGLLTLGLNADEIECVLQGVRDEVHGEKLPAFKEEEFENMQNFIIQKERERLENTKKSAETFFKNKDIEPGIQKTASGLRYKIIKAGDTVRASDDYTVEFDYEGKFIDGKIFDSTNEQGRKPISFYIGGLIPGLREALTLVCKGREIQVFIPSDLAYGDGGSALIPGGSTLDFTIKIHKITKPEPEFNIFYMPNNSPTPGESNEQFENQKVLK
jgi:FKBP-type peptidyl-prolyl cis-trans isomerase